MAELVFPPQAGKEHGAQRSGPRSGNEVFALLGRTGTGRCLVAVPDTSLSTAGVFGFARSNGSDASNLAGTGLAVLAAVLPASPRIPGKPGHRERQCPQQVSGALPIRREHPEVVGESIVQGFLIASIILCTLGSAVPVYGCIHPGKS